MSNLSKRWIATVLVFTFCATFGFALKEGLRDMIYWMFIVSFSGLFAFLCFGLMASLEEENK